jgi:hypothetical protein
VVHQHFIVCDEHFVGTASFLVYSQQMPIVDGDVSHPKGSRYASNTIAYYGILRGVCKSVHIGGDRHTHGNHF